MMFGSSEHFNDHTKLYAVSYIHFGDNELKTDFVYADNEQQAMLEMMLDNGWSEDIYEDVNVHSTNEEIKQFAFDGDCMVDAVAVP